MPRRRFIDRARIITHSPSPRVPDTNLCGRPRIVAPAPRRIAPGRARARRATAPQRAVHRIWCAVIASVQHAASLASTANGSAAYDWLHAWSPLRVGPGKSENDERWEMMGDRPGHFAVCGMVKAERKFHRIGRWADAIGEVTEMRIPGFTAERSLCDGTRFYKMGRPSGGWAAPQRVLPQILIGGGLTPPQCYQAVRGCLRYCRTLPKEQQQDCFEICFSIC